MVKQVIKSNNNWLFMATNFCPELDLFEGISQEWRKKIYECAISVKNALFETDFQEAPESLASANPIMYRIYEAVRGYATNPNTAWYNMPSTKVTMFIVTKVLYRTKHLQVA